jgi:hypothetical protein
MSIGDIQLTREAYPDDEGTFAGNAGGPTMAKKYQPDEKPRSNVVLGEAPTDRGMPDDLENSALPRGQVEMFLREIKH